jgi:hypothetical protein
MVQVHTGAVWSWPRPHWAKVFTWLAAINSKPQIMDFHPLKKQVLSGKTIAFIDVGNLIKPFITQVVVIALDLN